VTDKLLVVLQNCVYVKELVRGSYSEPFHHGNQFIRTTFEVKEEPFIATMQTIKTEQEEQDLLAVTMPAIKTEQEEQDPFIATITAIKTEHDEQDPLAVTMPTIKTEQEEQDPLAVQRT
jgi:outer membrane protein assembly factor BamA